MNNDKYTDGELFNLISGSEITGESSYDLWKGLNPDGTAEEFIEYLRNTGTDVTEPIIDALISFDLIEVLVDEDGSIMIDEDGSILYEKIKDGSSSLKDIVITGEYSNGHECYLADKVKYNGITLIPSGYQENTGFSGFTTDEFEKLINFINENNVRFIFNANDGSCKLCSSSYEYWGNYIVFGNQCGLGIATNS